MEARTRNILIAALTGVALGVGGWYFFVYKPAQEKKSAGGAGGGKKGSGSGAGSTSDQFDKLVDTANKSGKDIFQGITTDKLKALKDNFLASLTTQDADKLISLMSKKESDWTASEKIDAIALIEKVLGKKIKS